MERQACTRDEKIKQILVVDASLHNSQFLATILALEGYEVTIASCGYTAIAKIEANPPDLVLLDAILPELDGIQVARWIRYNRPNVAVMLMTENNKTATAPYPFGIRGYISKPFNFKTLLAQIESVCQLPTEKLNVGCKQVKG
ncbi:response regulator [Candidatus Gracilibacteria bacterium]|nr:response regulator [Candidatus Gracilibacteria bacterium]NJM88798.1 response regulator [Hydrococcus sp. RU_2_2]NJP19368.1 response regulator [Hydrococcus sp. CRU_1_1]NJQ97279.1 response regulator [Hydrococcus sp. CSU_1_8]